MTLQLEGADLTVLAPPEAENAVAWLLMTSSRPSAIPEGLCWAVAQAADTFVWGVLVGEIWKWATQDADRDVRPPQANTLMEVRAFSPESELLLWRTEASFAGRILRDAIPCNEAGQNLSPQFAFTPLDRRSYFLPIRDEDGTVMGKISATADPDFLMRQEGNGRTTVTPIGSGVLLRNYLERCQDTGMLRIAATRFFSIFQE